MVSKAKPTRRQVRSDLSKLKKLGLYKPKAPGPVKVTDYGLRQRSKYRDVLAGRATVVKSKAGKVHVASDIATRKAITKKLSAGRRASFYRGTLQIKGDRIVVPHSASQRPRFDAKTGTITIDVKNAGVISRGQLRPISLKSSDDLRRLEARGMVFHLPFARRTLGGGHSIDWLTWSDVEELIQDMTAYGTKYKNWPKYVVLSPAEPGSDRMYRDMYGGKRIGRRRVKDVIQGRKKRSRKKKS